jgi:hypothetical protein
MQYVKLKRELSPDRNAVNITFDFLLLAVFEIILRRNTVIHLFFILVNKYIVGKSYLFSVVYSRGLIKRARASIFTIVHGNHSFTIC